VDPSTVATEIAQLKQLCAWAAHPVQICGRPPEPRLLVR
jgi:hypothetical protein